jgi:hypothetical protein
MYQFWDTLIRPLLDRRQPQTLLEVGAFEGDNTTLLLAYCQQHGAVLHAVDPLPRFDADAWVQESGGAFVFHRAKSLEVLRSLPVPDVALIDGDHNWYTVYHELGQLAEAATAAGRPFPLTLFHDIAWPYARRDLYYDPADIPPPYRQPYARKGILPGHARLHKYGINQSLYNARVEGGPRNGVLTAVEDFVAAHSEPLRLLLLPGFHGLGILSPASLATEQPATAAHLERLAVGLEVLGPHMEALDNLITTWVVATHRAQLRAETDAAASALDDD